MPVLPNPRHESFAQYLAKNKTADEAYALAGFKPNRGNAARLNANESIRKRVQELQGKAAEKAEWTAADRLKTLSEIVGRTADKDPRVAVSAISEANKMDGSLAAAKHHLTGTIQVVTITAKQLDGLSADELAALEVAYPVLQKLGLVGGDRGTTPEAPGAGEP